MYERTWFYYLLCFYKCNILVVGWLLAASGIIHMFRKVEQQVLASIV